MRRCVLFRIVSAGVALFSLAPAHVALAAGQDDRPVPRPANERVLERIARESEAVITGRHFTYDPAGRRDPFEPLVKAEPVRKGKRPKGIAGMLVAEIDLKGVAVDPTGRPVALFHGSDNRGYLLRVGDVVYDARVIKIDPVSGLVVFRQQVDDPRRIKPYRDVIKRLRPSDEDIDPLEEEGA